MSRWPKSGFTQVELIMTIALLGIVSIMAIPLLHLWSGNPLRTLIAREVLPDREYRIHNLIQKDLSHTLAVQEISNVPLNGAANPEFFTTYPQSASPWDTSLDWASLLGVGTTETGTSLVGLGDHETVQWSLYITATQTHYYNQRNLIVLDTPLNLTAHTDGWFLSHTNGPATFIPYNPFP